MNIENIDWNYYLKRAYELALFSKDPSTQNGSILLNRHGNIISEAWNAFPDNVLEKKERWERPLKYKIIEHAERNAIYKAASQGLSTKDGILVCPWAACTDCARGIIQAGIKLLVTHKQASDRSPDFWRQDIDIALEMFKESDVQVIAVDGALGVEKGVLHSGQVWYP